MTTQASVTPAMRQYLDAKRQYRDAIVFFRMGDFYEMFYEDALVGARALDLTLTSRSKDAGGAGIPMCGVPYHAADGYLARLVKQGHRVAICEQVEDPKKAKGLVRREVVRVVSPGTLTDSQHLDAREPAFVMAVVSREGEFGAALLDVTTGEFAVAEFRGPDAAHALADEMVRVRPKELLLPADAPLPTSADPHLTIPVTRADGWTFDLASAQAALVAQLRTHGLAGYGLDGRDLAVCAAGALVTYLRDTQKVDLAHVRAVNYKSATDHLLIDPVTLKHLEIVTGSDGTAQGSLLREIDRTATAMGGRLLRSWLLRPLVSLDRIRDRLDAVEEFAFRGPERARCRETLGHVQDVERLVGRVVLGTAGPRDLVALRASLGVIPRVRMLLAELGAPLVTSVLASLDDLADVRDAIERTIVEEPPALTREGGFTRDGVDPELDELRGISRSGKQVIAEMEERERARTGIASLKVRFNRVFGYYIEISKSNLHAVPDDYHRKQTIAGGERFTTPALKEYEEKVLGADERIVTRELELFERLRASIAAEAPRLQESARALATLDVLAALAETAATSNYFKPHVHDGDELVATDVRHPVVERLSPDPFVPNDVELNGTTRQLIVMTGPNMGGKSTYLRQTALLPLLAQIGSFVPARDAKVPIVDRIFARVGASDNISRGQSTFMVEMQETAHILHTATSRSLVVLDEIGRGTSTFDGLSLAWAVAEHLVKHPTVRPKTLFATHYHELTDLADSLPGVVNAHVAAREWKDDIIFLRKIVPGRSDRSYGIQVARLAGLPPSVIARARHILEGLERDELSRGGRPALSPVTDDTPSPQLGLFAQDLGPAAPPEHEAIVRRLQTIDPDDLTPRQALDILADLKGLLP
jgi:DNA mismatch repair protein MutS